MYPKPFRGSPTGAPCAFSHDPMTFRLGCLVTGEGHQLRKGR